MKQKSNLSFREMESLSKNHLSQIIRNGSTTVLIDRSFNGTLIDDWKREEEKTEP